MATMVHPNGVWLKTHLFVKDGRLHATTYLQAAGNPQILNVSVSLRETAAMLSAYHQKVLHRGGKVAGCIGGDCADDDSDFSVSGCVGCDAIEVGRRKHRRRKGIFRAAKLRVLKKTFDKVRKVMSKVVKPLLYVAAVVYPPVGAPALAAYTVADKVLKGIEKGTNYANAAGKLIQHGKKVKVRTAAKLVARATKKGLFQKHGKAKVMATIQNLAGKAVAKKLSKTKASRHLREQAAGIIMTGRKNREYVRRAITDAGSGSLKDQKKQAILRLVAAHHERLRKLGMYVDPSGNTGMAIKVSGAVTIGGSCVGCSGRVYPI